MADRTSMQELWHRCAEFITGFEQRCATESFVQWHSSSPFFADDVRQLQQALPSIEHALFTYVEGNSTHCLGESGLATAPGDKISCARQLIAGQSVRVDVIWNASEFAAEDHNHGRQAIREFCESVTAVLVAAVSRAKLQSSTAEIADVSATLQRMQTPTSDTDACHQISADLANALKLERCHLLTRRGHHFSLLGSSVQRVIDLRSQKAISLQHLATTITQQFESAQQVGSATQSDVAVISCDQTSPEYAESMGQLGISQVIAIRLANGQAIAIGELEEKQHDDSVGHILSDARLAAFNSVVTQLCQRMMGGKVTRLSNQLGLSKVRNRFIAAAIILALLWIIPLRVKVAADGQVVPIEQHVVYAPVTGRLEKLLCRPGQMIKAGDPLCQFSSHDIDLQLTQLQGEIFTTKEKIEIATTRRSDDTVKDVASDRRVLETQLQSLEEQLGVLKQRQRDLSIVSPIDGRVSLIRPEDLGPTTNARPVTIGQGVLRVVNPDAGYMIRANVRDREIGYVLAALKRSDSQPVSCKFRIRSDSAAVRQGTVSAIDVSAKLDRYGNLVVPVEITPDQTSLEADKASAGIAEPFSVDSNASTWIICENASSGFVLFRGMIEQLRLWGWL